MHKHTSYVHTYYIFHVTLLHRTYCAIQSLLYKESLTILLTRHTLASLLVRISLLLTHWTDFILSSFIEACQSMKKKRKVPLNNRSFFLLLSWIDINLFFWFVSLGNQRKVNELTEKSIESAADLVKLNPPFLFLRVTSIQRNMLFRVL